MKVEKEKEGGGGREPSNGCLVHRRRKSSFASRLPAVNEILFSIGCEFHIESHTK